MSKALTAPAVEKLKPGATRREIPDGLMPGLYLVIQTSGKKSWAVRYRAHGKPRKLTLGPYPVLGLSDARKAAQSALMRALRGGDPAAEKRAAREKAPTTFEVIAREFLSRYAKPKNRSWKETARLLGLAPSAADGDPDNPFCFVVVKGGLVAKWGHRDLSGIRSAEVISEIDRIVDRGAPIVANRTLAALRKMFNWAMARKLLTENPCGGVETPAAEKSRDRVLTDDEIKAFWQACGELGEPFGPLFRFLLLTGQRREEVAAMTFAELDGDTWTIPRERAKNSKAHAVPLSEAARSILSAVPVVESDAGYIFTSTGKSHVSGFSKAKARLDERMLEILQDAGNGLPEWRLHDLRRTMASGMARLGINLPIIEKVLNHSSGSFRGIVGVYQRHEFQPEKRAALLDWARFVTVHADPALAVQEPVVRAGIMSIAGFLAALAAPPTGMGKKEKIIRMSHRVTA